MYLQLTKLFVLKHKLMQIYSTFLVNIEKIKLNEMVGRNAEIEEIVVVTGEGGRSENALV